MEIGEDFSFPEGADSWGGGRSKLWRRANRVLMENYRFARHEDKPWHRQNGRNGSYERGLGV